MRHYEIIFLVHPDQSEQVVHMVDKYKKIIAENGGKIHRLEDWGRRHLAYPIQKLAKAHYVCMNVECNNTVLENLNLAFKYNDAILRNSIISTKKAETEPSIYMKDEKSKSLI